MNILFIGPYLEDNDVGTASLNYLRALLSIEEYNVAAVPIFSSQDSKARVLNPYEITKAEMNICDEYDIVIHNTSPKFFQKHRIAKKNIGIVLNRVKISKHDKYISNMNIMDEIWVHSYEAYDNLLDAGVTVPISVVPVPIDIENINLQTNPLNIPEARNKFVFYVSGEYNEFFDLDKLIAAYNIGFSHIRDVILILNLYADADPQKIQAELKKYIITAKERLGLYSSLEQYANELIIPAKLDTNQRSGLHRLGDCFILPTRGQIYSTELVESLAFGNRCITTNQMSENIHSDNINIVGSVKSPVDIVKRNNQYNAFQSYDEILIETLMRVMYIEYKRYKDKNGVKSPSPQYDLSINAVGNLIKEILCQ